MLKKLFSLLLFVFLFQEIAFSQDVKIDWGTRVVVNDMPGNYGSQYGRMLHLKNGKLLAAYTVSVNAGYRKDPNGGLRLQISESDDGGLHWKKISRISDPGRDLDNAELIQLPDGVVLLACRSVRWQQSYRLPVYKSADGGKAWKRISMIDENEGKPGQLGHPDKGVYEPHFCFLKDGRLAVMYANEKHVTDNISYSQIVSEKISPDHGKTWGKEIWVAYQPGDHLSRPGMPVWTQMNNDKYMVVYEVCGPQKCNIYNKISKDGIHWPVGLGHEIPDQTGAPYILSLKDGQLLVTSNRANISVSNDYGKSWYQSDRPWKLKKSYEADWTQAIWSALYQTGINKICIISSVKRDTGGHHVQLRFGKVDVTFTNPLLSSGADPWMIRRDGWYYYMQTTGKNLKIWKTRNPAFLRNAEHNVVWTPPRNTAYSKGIWAPELHFIKNKWYIYFAADNGNNYTHHIYVLENSSPDPLKGQWVFKGKITDASDKWAIDASVFEYKNQWYMIWSGWQGDTNGQQNIYIAKMKNPWTIEGKRARISAPFYNWEKHGNLPAGSDVPHVNVNEGPEILKHDGDVFLTYSASGCWTDYYALGMLKMVNKNNLLDSASWEKFPQPVLKQSSENSVYATGHNCFFKSPNGKQYWIIYHANDKPGEGCGPHRSPRMQPFTWKKDDTPDFGIPVKINVPLPIPANN